MSRPDAVRLERKPDEELGAEPRAVAPRFDDAAVHVGEPRDEREANAQAAFGTIERRVRLHEKVEDTRQHVGADADARVPHADDRVWTLALDGDGDTASRRRVLRRVAQQVLEHLPETHSVARDRDRCAGDADLEAMSAGVHDGAAHLRGDADDAPDVQALAFERDLPLCHSRHVEQIVDDSRHATRLAGDDLQRTLRLGSRHLTLERGN